MSLSLSRPQNGRPLGLPVVEWICSNCFLGNSAKRRKISTTRTSKSQDASALKHHGRYNTKAAGPWVHGLDWHLPARGNNAARRRFRSVGSSAVASAAVEDGDLPVSDMLTASECWRAKWGDHQRLLMGTNDSLPSSGHSSGRSLSFKPSNTLPMKKQVPGRLIRLAVALREMDTDQLTVLLNEAQDEPGFLESIPKTTWSEIVRLLDSRRFMAPLHAEHRSFSHGRTRHLARAAVISPDSYLRMVMNIVNIRRVHRLNIGVGDYRRLLANAARIGNPELARALWSALLEDGLIPDAACYQALLEAIVWDEGARTRMKRSTIRLPDFASSHNTDSVVQRPAAAAEVRRIWKEMLTNGVEPNTGCYCVIMVSLAQEGDSEGVYDVVSRVSGVDVHSFLGAADASQPKDLGSYPVFDNRLLSSLAYAFGYLNKIPLGLRIIDHISNTHGIEISQGVWYVMTRWAWIQARTKSEDKVSSNLPVLQQRLFDIASMGTVMQSPPYHISPSMDLRDLIFRAHGLTIVKSGDALGFREMISHMEAGRQLLISQINAYRTALDQYHRAELKLGQGRNTLFLVKNAQAARKKASDLKIKKTQTKTMLSRWAMSLIPLKNIDRSFGTPSAAFDRWRVVGLPNFIQVWSAFLPDTVKYRIATGRVDLVVRTHAEVLARDDHKGANDTNTKAFRWRDLSRDERRLDNKAWKGHGQANSTADIAARVSYPYMEDELVEEEDQSDNEVLDEPAPPSWGY